MSWPNDGLSEEHDGLSEECPRITNTDSAEDLLEVKEFWVEDIRSFQIVVQLEGKRELCQHSLCNVISSKSLSADPKWNGSNSKNTGCTIESDSSLRDSCAITTEERTSEEVEGSAHLDIDCQLMNDDEPGLMSHWGHQKENVQALEEEEDEVSSAIFTCLFKTKISPVFKSESSLHISCWTLSSFAGIIFNNELIKYDMGHGSFGLPMH